jgi:hypothetical protein
MRFATISGGILFRDAILRARGLLRSVEGSGDLKKSGIESEDTGMSGKDLQTATRNVSLR